jgi:probable O-glycosylation ligase (exosortase A-associated)
MRDLMMFGAMLFFVPLAVMDAFAAYLLWGWTAVLSPVYYFYGFMQSMRFNLIFAALALILLPMQRRNTPPFSANSTFVLMLVLLLHAMLSAAFGYPNNPYNAALAEQFLKSMVYCLVMYWFVRDRHDLHAMLVMFGLGLGFHGVVEGGKVLASGGGHHVSGIPTSMMSDNNHFAVAMVLIIPILHYLSQYSAKRLVRWGFLGGMLLTVFAVLGTHSRGGMIALGVVGLWFLATSRHKIRAFFLVVLAAIVVVFVAPDSWFDRFSTIRDAGQDSSFMGRVVAWKVSSAIALNNPLFGGGFHALQAQNVWDTFKHSSGLLGFIDTPEPDLLAKAAHSIYFEILGDLGFVGLFLFLAVFANAFLIRYRIKSMVKRAGENFVWALDAANALMLALMAYLAGGAGVSLGYFEVPYMLAMVMELLKQQVERGMGASAASAKKAAA